VLSLVSFQKKRRAYSSSSGKQREKSQGGEPSPRKRKKKKFQRNLNEENGEERSAACPEVNRPLTEGEKGRPLRAEGEGEKRRSVREGGGDKKERLAFKTFSEREGKNSPFSTRAEEEPFSLRRGNGREEGDSVLDDLNFKGKGKISCQRFLHCQKKRKELLRLIVKDTKKGRKKKPLSTG